MLGEAYTIMPEMSCDSYFFGSDIRSSLPIGSTLFQRRHLLISSFNWLILTILLLALLLLDDWLQARAIQMYIAFSNALLARDLSDSLSGVRR
jgi:hypothetical protein